jgi:ATP-dependent helicase/nuclease subunit B
MAVRFIMGRAGSGKTFHCLEAIRGRLAPDAVNGPRLLLLVPEQAALQMERAILAPSAEPMEGASLSAACRAEVLSFRRLAFRVLESTGAAPRPALTEPARAMVLRHLLTGLRSQLRYYRRIAGAGRSAGHVGGFANELAATVAELIEEAVEPDALARPADDGSDSADPAQRAKLHDLRLIYSAYLHYLGTERLDPSRYLEVARPLLERAGWLRDAELWVDGFASLSRQETLTLIDLARLCRSTEITVLFDPADASRFGRPAETYRELIESFSEAGLAVEEPLLLAADPGPRFRRHGGLAQLERRLFAVPVTGRGTASTAPAGIEVVELPTRRIEVDYAVSQVCEWVQNPATRYRYRDIALIVRDMEPYHDLLSEALRARSVPFFIDRRRPAAHHPLVEFLRGTVAMVGDGMSLDSVRLAMKTGLLPVSVESADSLENYLIAHGISGVETWRGGDWTFRGLRGLDEEPAEPTGAETAELRIVNEARRRIVERLDAWLQFAAEQGGHTGPQWTEAAHRLIARLGVAERLKEWSDEAQRAGDLDQAEEHRQVWRDVMSFLDDLAEAFRETALSVEELADVLEAGLSGLTLGLVPPAIDQVLVSSIERSRHPDIKAAVSLGFNDGVFPLRPAEDSILNDDDRQRLSDMDVRVGPPSRDRVLDESLLLYIAATRPSEALTVTYATADGEGKALRASPYLPALLEACPGLAVRSIADPSRERVGWDVLCESDLIERLAMEFRQRPTRAADDSTVRGRWNALYESMRGDGAERVRRAFRGLREEPKVELSATSVKRMFAEPLSTSVSQLESYAACPFQYFSRHVLDLRERPEAALKAVDIGQVHHAILEDFVQGVVRRGGSLGEISDAELLEHLDESCSRITERLPDGGAVSDARSAYLLRRSAAQLARVIQGQKRLAAGGSARPKAVEVPFGFEQPGSLPALELTTPAGRRIRLRGYIDRVDLAELADEALGVVIDYKRRRDKRVDLSSVYHGLSLQLLAYLLVLRAHGRTLAGRPIRPIGALFVPVTSQYRAVEHPSEISEDDAFGTGAARARGLLLFERMEALDSSFGTGRSKLYNVERRKDGEVGRVESSDGATAPAFEGLLEHTRQQLGALADGVLDGNMNVSPFRLGTFSPCSWCAMPAVCRYEVGISRVRFLDKMKRSEVFAKLAGQK